VEEGLTFGGLVALEEATKAQRHEEAQSVAHAISGLVRLSVFVPWWQDPEGFHQHSLMSQCR